MAKTYTSTAVVRCAKEHTCAGCGTAYEYELVRTVKGSSRRSPEAATRQARAAVDRTVRRAVNAEACPACGLVQPDMVGQQRYARHLWVAAVAVVAAVVVLCIRGADNLAAIPATWILAAIAAVAAVAFLFVEAIDPNHDVDGNRQRAEGRAALGDVRVTAAGRATGGSSPWADAPGRVRPRWPLLAILAFAPVVAVLPEVVRAARAWPANPACYPPVVGPGDATRVYFNQTITSVKGYFRGTSETTVQADASPPVPVPSSTADNDWGSSISVKDGEKSNQTRPWVELTMPTDPALAGRTVDCVAKLSLEYPVIGAGETSFNTYAATLVEHFPIRLGPARSGAAYDTTWWAASGTAAGLLALGGAALALAAHRLRTPGTVTNTRPLGPNDRWPVPPAFVG